MSFEDILRLDKKLMTKQKSISFIKDEFQISTKNNISGKTRKENNFGCMVMYWKIAHYESYGKTDTKLNTKSENMTYLVDKKIILCPHKIFNR